MIDTAQIETALVFLLAKLLEHKEAMQTAAQP
jgi:hypothetical protein